MIFNHFISGVLGEVAWETSWTTVTLLNNIAMMDKIGKLEDHDKSGMLELLSICLKVIVFENSDITMIYP